MFNWIYRRGIDWNVGYVPLADHVFIDGVNGVDSPGNGSPTNPYKSLTYAKSQEVGVKTAVFAPYVYIDQLGGVGSYETWSIIGDSEDQDVVFVDTTTSRFGIGNTSRNIVLKGYSVPKGGFVRLEYSTVIDCASFEPHTASVCKIINTNVTPTINSYCYNSMFFNSPTLFNDNDTCRYYGCFMDADSFVTVAGTGEVQISQSHVVDDSTWSTLPVYSGNTTGDPLDYAFEKLDYRIQPESPLFGRGITGGFGNFTSVRNLGGTIMGAGFYDGITEFDAEIAANPNLDIVSNELVNIGPNNIEYVETPEIQVTRQRVFGMPLKVGVINWFSSILGKDIDIPTTSIDRTIEVAYAANLVDPLGPYKKYRFGEQMSENTGGTSNGEDTYTWDDNNFIGFMKYKVRFGVIKGGLI